MPLAGLAELSPPGAVPVLIDGEAITYDSLAIMEYANELGGGSLLPMDTKLRAQTRSLVAWQHSSLSIFVRDSPLRVRSILLSEQ
jgi:glutathione S-transferase